MDGKLAGKNLGNKVKVEGSNKKKIFFEKLQGIVKY